MLDINLILLIAAIIPLAFLPTALKKETAARLEEELPIFLSYVYARLEAGWSLRRALEAAAGEKELMPTFHRESSRIIREAEVRGDLTGALLEYRSPSKRVTNVIRSLGEEASTGFDPTSRIKVLLWDEEEYAAERARKRSESVENLAEASMTIMVLIPLFISFTAMFGGGLELIFPLAAVSSIITYIAASALYGAPIVMLSSRSRRVLPAQALMIGAVVFLTLPFREFSPLDPWLYIGLGAALIALSIPASYEVKKAIGEMEGGHLLAQGLAIKLELGYPVHKSFQMVRDGRVAEQVRRVTVGVQADPRSRQLQLVLSTIKVVKDSGAGARALEVVARTSQRLYHAYRDTRSRLRFYEIISMSAGAVILAMSYAITRPLKEFSARYAPQVAGGPLSVQPTPFIHHQPALAGIGDLLLPASVILSLILGLAISKLCDHTAATTWRAGVGIIAATLIYLFLSPYW
ncbi:MAG: type II secretion system F family protein [Nitrososphaeria archaeon]|nr:type II secretion system F family protein [Nitrososphaeria archaeon]